MKTVSANIKTVRGSFWWFDKSSAEAALDHKFFGPYYTTITLRPGVYQVIVKSLGYRPHTETRVVHVKGGDVLIGDPFWAFEDWDTAKSVFERMRVERLAFEVVLGSTGVYSYGFEITEKPGVKPPTQGLFMREEDLRITR